MYYGWFTENLERGFDILSNKKINDVKDKESKIVYDAHCTKPVDVWTKLMRNTSNGFEEVKTIGELWDTDSNDREALWKTS